MRKLSWKPVRHGKLYCAPACGHGCTRKEYDSAVKAAQRLARRLGRGWKTRVSENMGWSYDVIDKTGCLKVHAFIFKGRVHSYTAYLGEGEFGGRWVEGGKTPEEAIRLVRRQAMKALASVQRLVSAIKDA